MEKIEGKGFEFYFHARKLWKTYTVTMLGQHGNELLNFSCMGLHDNHWSKWPHIDGKVFRLSLFLKVAYEKSAKFARAQNLKYKKFQTKTYPY